ncbi:MULTISPECIES: TIGR03915 family putative DNA repair protein [Thermodesulfovibrio]|jgi:probable DNA metabolism protein|uniref:TIGR03915 family putative DNA repair protein n=1 Tax=Thermodesulfovibrio TaxID=28261 RepID=UPI002621449E|nr:TIGR03915 family putative DNA repair protein [Thermodesulfovibrio sp.]
MQTIYYDGTLEGFLTLLYRYVHQQIPFDGIIIKNSRLHSSELDLFSFQIYTEIETAKKYYKYLSSKLPKEIFRKIYLYYLCDSAKIEDALIRVLRQSYENPSIWYTLDSDIVKLNNAERMFRREKHRWLGFLRFTELPDKVLFAKFEPKFNVLPKLWLHFVKRLPNEKIIIFDSLRKLLFANSGKYRRLLWADGFEVDISSEIDSFINLWQRYFKDIAIPERLSYERQRNRLPLRFRRFLSEFT